MRAPAGARTCSLSWPAPPEGGTRGRRADGKAEHDHRGCRAMIEDPIQKSLVGRSQAVESPVEGVVNVPDELAGGAGRFRISDFGIGICGAGLGIVSRSL